MNKIPILCSTGAFITRANGRNYHLLEALSEKLTCDGFEFMMYESWYEKYHSIIDDVKQMNLFIPVFHVEKSIGELLASGRIKDYIKSQELFQINCEMAREFGAKKLVLHLWNGTISDQYIKRNIAGYADLVILAAKEELELTIENVVCNQTNPMNHWLELHKLYSDVKFTFDTKMAAFHNQIHWLYDKEWAWLWNENHISHIHVNDYSGGYMNWQSLKTLHIGKGTIDFHTFFEWLKLHRTTSYLTIEATSVNPDGSLRTDEMNESIRKIRDYMQ